MIMKMKSKYLDKIFIFFAIAPVILYFLIFMYYPFAMNIAYMFYKYNYISSPKFVGLQNITKFLSEGAAWQPFFNTFIITLISVPVIIVLAIFLSMTLFNLKIGQAFFRSAVFLPYITSFIVAATIFKMLFGNEFGFINSILEAMGSNRIPWLLEPTTAIICIILVSVWKYLGYYIVIFLAGLSNVSNELIEASKLDGANAIQTFFYVTIPQLKPTIVFSSIVAVITFLRTYPTVVVLTNGGPYSSTKTILMYMFEQAFNSRNVGFASVIAVALFLIILAITLLQMKITKTYSEGE
jgi:ABC-type sugar transport system permease subunit